MIPVVFFASPFQVWSEVQVRVKIDIVSKFRIANDFEHVGIARRHRANERCSSGREGSHTAPAHVSASRTLVWVYSNENDSGSGALQRAPDPQRRMQALIDDTLAPLDGGPSAAASQEAEPHRDGMLDELEELHQSAKSQKK
jgi:hypothetical protein